MVSEYEDIKFVHSFDEKFKKELNASTITLFKSFDDKKNIMEEPISINNLKKFIEMNSIRSIF